MQDRRRLWSWSQSQLEVGMVGFVIEVVRTLAAKRCLPSRSRRGSGCRTRIRQGNGWRAQQDLSLKPAVEKLSGHGRPAAE